MWYLFILQIIFVSFYNVHVFYLLSILVAFMYRPVFANIPELTSFIRVS